MTVRLQTICSHLPKVRLLADVGCDHGYCTQYAFEHGLCERAVLSDISEGSLQKAKTLLSAYAKEGKCTFVCADGMKGLPSDCDCVLIAGLGGEEIVKILSEGYLPPYFVLQPMKNAEKVREYLLGKGCKLERDFTFFAEGMYYDFIVGVNEGRSEYSSWEIKFGRDNLKEIPSAFVEKLREERRKIHGYLARNMSEESRQGVLKRLNDIEVILNAVEDDL